MQPTDVAKELQVLLRQFIDEESRYKASPKDDLNLAAFLEWLEDNGTIKPED